MQAMAEVMSPRKKVTKTQREHSSPSLTYFEDRGTVLDAPLEVVWDFMQKDEEFHPKAHAPTLRNFKTKALSEVTNVIRFERRTSGGRWTKFVSRMTVMRPAVRVKEDLEGPYRRVGDGPRLPSSREENLRRYTLLHAIFRVFPHGDKAGVAEDLRARRRGGRALAAPLCSETPCWHRAAVLIGCRPASASRLQALAAPAFRGQVGEWVRGVDCGGALRAHRGHRHGVSAEAARGAVRATRAAVSPLWNSAANAGLQ